MAGQYTARNVDFEKKLFKSFLNSSISIFIVDSFILFDKAIEITENM